MVDVHTKEQRSCNMAAIKNRGNKSTEIAFLQLLTGKKISGWRRHYKPLIGTPDFVFLKQRIAIFIDGCFWHGCLKCRLEPKTNRKFWRLKIRANKERDKKVNKALREKKWKVLRFWEHQIKKNPEKVIEIIEKNLI